MSNIYHIKFFDRPSSSLDAKRLVDLYTKNVLKFDTELISSEGLKVSAHRQVLSLCSMHLKKKLDKAEPLGIIQVKLKDITHDILQKVVELFYMRELLVSEQLKPKIIEALTLLKTYDIGVLGKRFRKKLTNDTDGFVYSIAPKNGKEKPMTTAVPRDMRKRVNPSQSRADALSLTKKPVVLMTEKITLPVETVEYGQTEEVHFEIDRTPVDENTEYANLCSEVTRLFGANDLRDILPALRE